MKLLFCCPEMKDLLDKGGWYHADDKLFLPGREFEDDFVTVCPYCGAKIEVGMAEAEKKHAWKEGLFAPTIKPETREKLRAVAAQVEEWEKEAGMASSVTRTERNGVTLSLEELNWMNNGEHGSSSAFMFYVFTGVNVGGESARDVETEARYPHDPDDLRRCMLMLDMNPSFRARMPELLGKSAVWDVLVPEWATLEVMLRKEMVEPNDGKAPETYQKMQEIIKVGRNWRADDDDA